MRQQLPDFTGPLCRQPRQHIFEVDVCPFIRADCIKLMIAAARLALRSDPANSQFERPSAHGRIWFST